MPTTTPDYVSSVSLLPTLEFLELVGKKQWDSTVSYGLGISTIVTRFHSTTNSEWLCLNTEAEFLESPIGTISIKNPFAYTRPESSPVYVGYNDISIPPAKANKAKSLYLFRIDEDGKNEVIMVSNYDKKPDNVTSAPPIDCFSRECLTWFSSDVDWFIGFGNLSGSLDEIIDSENGIISEKSSSIINSKIESFPINYSNIQIVGSVSTLSPFVVIQLSTGVQYNEPLSHDIMFLYNSDDIVSFAHQFDDMQSEIANNMIILTEVSWSSNDGIVII